MTLSIHRDAALSLKQELEDLGEAKCESQHKAADNLICTIEVTHAVTGVCDSEEFLVCHAAADVLLDRMERGHYCRRCWQPASICWSLRLV